MSTSTGVQWSFVVSLMKGLCLFLMCSVLGRAIADTVYVDINNSSGIEDGTSWSTAYLSIQSGLDASHSGDMVLVAEGIYVENLVIDHDVKLLSTNIDEPEDFIIDGNGQGGVIEFVNTQGGHTEDAEIAGFTIQNGVRYSGGGISGDLTNGPNLERGCLAHIHHNVIRYNTANGSLSDPYLGRGGGLYFCTGIVEHNQIYSNVAYNSGGGACNLAELDQHEAQFGIFRHNSVVNNVAGLSPSTGGAGGVESYAEVSSNIISGNSGHYGAAISRATVVRNNVIYGNLTSRGTTNYCKNIENNSIVFNLAANIGDPSGVFVEGFEYDVYVRNNILWGNEGSQIANYSWYTTTIENSCVQGGYTSQDPDENVWNIVSGDPAFEDQYSTPPNFRLTDTSSCIDAGTEIADLRKDIDGVSRPGYSAWDIGAYEYNGPPIDCMTCSGTPEEILVDNPLDAELSGWQIRTGTWYFGTDQTYGSVLSCTTSTQEAQVFHPADTPDVEYEFSYVLRSGSHLILTLRDAGAGFGGLINLYMHNSFLRIYSDQTGWSQFDYAEGSDYGTWYDIRACVTGSRLQVERRVRGTGGWTLVFDSPTCPLTTSGGFGIRVASNSSGSFDNFKASRTTVPYCGLAEQDPDLSFVSPIARQDFQSGILPPSWSVVAGSFGVSDSGDGNGNLALQGTSTNAVASHAYPQPNSGNFETRFSYKLVDISDYPSTAKVWVQPRFASGTSNLGVFFTPHTLSVVLNLSGSYVTDPQPTITSLEGQWYDVKITMEGPNMAMFRRVPGCEWKQIYTRTWGGVPGSAACRIGIQGATSGQAFLDNISVQELP